MLRKKYISELSKEEKKLEKQEKKELKKINKKIDKDITELLPFLDVTENEAFETKDGVMDMFQISSCDIYTLNKEEINAHISTFATFLRTYQDDIKIISMNFPVNTFIQQQYFKRVIERTTNPTHLHFLKIKLDQLERIEFNRENKEFYIFIYANNEDEMDDKINLIFRLSAGKFKFSKIDLDKKIKILFKLSNQNTKI
ncbi:TPA: hypothetical protein ACKONR_000366 [Clostridioides difficile]|nr:hypothetical protein [Clostridioides difficile]MCC0664991.1 hypothetical protein [Clostridioides sp. ZZV15-6597]MCC0699452.1 hypothetical protein [Clostridioides sp. ZZV15-6383]EGT3815278.1 hypothetical protein [Clostridioides difficile]EGT4202985.1 hypothetical protein [Clostridioides difficile]ELX4570427.1 hypothetical protein [Clostridioides difficile]